MDQTPNALPKDRGTELAEERTSLALQRTALGAERTLMAWMRTALSMISFGFTLVKALHALESTQGKLAGPMGRTWTPEALGLSMMGIGTASLILAIFQYRKSLKTFRNSGLEFSWSLVSLVSTLVAMLGLFAFMSIALGW